MREGRVWCVMREAKVRHLEDGVSPCAGVEGDVYAVGDPEQDARRAAERRAERARDHVVGAAALHAAVGDDRRPTGVLEEVEVEPAEVEKPVEEKPVEEKPVEEEPMEEKLVEEKPIEEKAVEEKPIEKESPVEESSMEKKPAEEKPVEIKAVEEKLVQEKPSELKPKKPTAKKPAQKKKPVQKTGLNLEQDEAARERRGPKRYEPSRSPRRPTYAAARKDVAVALARRGQRQ